MPLGIGDRHIPHRKKFIAGFISIICISSLIIQVDGWSNGYKFQDSKVDFTRETSKNWQTNRYLDKYRVEPRTASLNNPGSVSKENFRHDQGYRVQNEPYDQQANRLSKATMVNERMRNVNHGIEIVRQEEKSPVLFRNGYENRLQQRSMVSSRINQPSVKRQEEVNRERIQVHKEQRITEQRKRLVSNRLRLGKGKERGGDVMRRTSKFRLETTIPDPQEARSSRTTERRLQLELGSMRSFNSQNRRELGSSYQIREMKSKHNRADQRSDATNTRSSVFEDKRKSVRNLDNSRSNSIELSRTQARQVNEIRNSNDEKKEDRQAGEDSIIRSSHVLTSTNRIRRSESRLNFDAERKARNLQGTSHSRLSDAKENERNRILKNNEENRKRSINSNTRLIEPLTVRSLPTNKIRRLKLTRDQTTRIHTSTDENRLFATRRDTTRNDREEHRDTERQLQVTNYRSKHFKSNNVQSRRNNESSRRMRVTTEQTSLRHTDWQKTLRRTNERQTKQVRSQRNDKAEQRSRIREENRLNYDQSATRQINNQATMISSEDRSPVLSQSSLERQNRVISHTNRIESTVEVRSATTRREIAKRRINIPAEAKSLSSPELLPVYVLVTKQRSVQGNRNGHGAFSRTRNNLSATRKKQNGLRIEHVRRERENVRLEQETRIRDLKSSAKRLTTIRPARERRELSEKSSRRQQVNDREVSTFQRLEIGASKDLSRARNRVSNNLKSRNDLKIRSEQIERKDARRVRDTSARDQKSFLSRLTSVRSSQQRWDLSLTFEDKNVRQDEHRDIALNQRLEKDISTDTFRIRNQTPNTRDERIDVKLRRVRHRTENMRLSRENRAGDKSRSRLSSVESQERIKLLPLNLDNIRSQKLNERKMSTQRSKFGTNMDLSRVRNDVLNVREGRNDINHEREHTEGKNRRLTQKSFVGDKKSSQNRSTLKNSFEQRRELSRTLDDSSRQRRLNDRNVLPARMFTIRENRDVLSIKKQLLENRNERNDMKLEGGQYGREKVRLEREVGVERHRSSRTRLNSVESPQIRRDLSLKSEDKSERQLVQRRDFPPVQRREIDRSMNVNTSNRNSRIIRTMSSRSKTTENTPRAVTNLRRNTKWNSENLNPVSYTENLRSVGKKDLFLPLSSTTNKFILHAPKTGFLKNDIMNDLLSYIRALIPGVKSFDLNTVKHDRSPFEQLSTSLVLCASSYLLFGGFTYGVTKKADVFPY